MQYAIFACLDDLKSHICKNLDWNGKNESQIIHDQNGEIVAALCNENSIPPLSHCSTVVWFEGKQLAAEINNPEDVLYITAVENLYPKSIHTSQKYKHLALVEFDGVLDLHNLVKSKTLNLIHSEI